MSTAQKLGDLPTELLHTIAECAERLDLLSLCRTNREIYAICVQCVYRKVSLDDLAQVVRCCRTLLSRREAAAAVRSLSISCHPERAVEGFYRTVGAALRRLHNLERLFVYASHSIFRLVADTRFPRLVECMIPASVQLLPFLRANPGIVTLQAMMCHEARAPESVESVVALDMPRLETFVGPPVLACCVVPGSRASSVTFYWQKDMLGMPFEDTLEALTRAEGDVAHLSCIFETWDGNLLDAVGRRLYRLEHLAFHKITEVRHTGKEAFLSRVGEILPLMTRLLRIDLMDDTYDGRSCEQIFDEEFKIVRRWGELCPTLAVIRLSGEPMCAWARFGHVGVWFAPIIIATHHRWFFKTVLALPDLSEGYRELAGLIAGDAGMRALEEAYLQTGMVPKYVLHKWGTLAVVSEDDTR